MIMNVALLASIAVSAIFLLLILYGLRGDYKLWLLRNAIFMQKRGIAIHFALNATLLFAIVASVGYIVGLFASHRLIAGISGSLSTVAGYLFLCFSITKSWLLYYREKWSYYTLRTEWFRIINNTAPSVDTNWFIRNNHKYGSRVYVTKVCLIYHALSICLGTAAVVLDSIPSFQNSLTLIYLLVAFPFIPSIAFYLFVMCKIAQFKLIDDPFLIHWESKWHSRLQLLLVLSFCVVVPIQSLHFEVGHALSTFVPCCIFYALHHVSSYSIYHRLHTSRVHIHVETEDASVTSSQQNNQSVDTVKLKTVLSNKQALHLFMQHLLKEYSHECLLAMIEIHQYQNYLLSQMTVKEKSELREEYSVKLAANVPLSSIVENAETDWRRKACELYEKYIRVGSEYEVNIDWETQNEFLPLVSNDSQILLNHDGVQKKDVFVLFDRVKVQMVRLLQYSLHRLRGKQEAYDKMLKVLHQMEGKSNSRGSRAEDESEHTSSIRPADVVVATDDVEIVYTK